MSIKEEYVLREYPYYDQSQCLILPLIDGSDKNLGSGWYTSSIEYNFPNSNELFTENITLVGSNKEWK